MARGNELRFGQGDVGRLPRSGAEMNQVRSDGGHGSLRSAVCVFNGCANSEPLRKWPLGGSWKRHTNIYYGHKYFGRARPHTLEKAISSEINRSNSAGLDCSEVTLSLEQGLICLK